MPEVGVCQREFAVRSSSCEVNDPQLKNEIFVRIDSIHTSQTICLQSIFFLLSKLLFAKN